MGGGAKSNSAASRRIEPSVVKMSLIESSYSFLLIVQLDLSILILAMFRFYAGLHNGVNKK